MGPKTSWGGASSSMPTPTTSRRSRRGTRAVGWRAAWSGSPRPNSRRRHRQGDGQVGGASPLELRSHPHARPRKDERGEERGSQDVDRGLAPPQEGQAHEAEDYG